MSEQDLINAIDRDEQIRDTAHVMLAALINVEAVLSIVRPRSDMAAYLAALEQVRAAIAKAESRS